MYIVSESSLSSDLHDTALLCGVGTRTIDGVDILSEDTGAGTDADLDFLEVLRTSLSSGDEMSAPSRTERSVWISSPSFSASVSPVRD